jgi:predicted phosphodiesterase
MPDIPSPDAPRPTLISVVTDTHVPDRQGQIHPQLLPRLERVGVSLILHAGDISLMRVLDKLRQVAPVTAVRGHRDWAIPGLPMVQKLSTA